MTHEQGQPLDDVRARPLEMHAGLAPSNGACAGSQEHSTGMAAAMTVLVLLGLNAALGALASARPATGRRDSPLARSAALRRLRREAESKTGNMDRVVCVLLQLGSSWCEKGARDGGAAALEDGGDGTEDGLRETAALPCRTPACKLFAKRKKQEKRRPPDQSPDSQFYSGW